MVALKEEEHGGSQSPEETFSCLCFAKLLDNVADGNSFFSSVTMRFFQALS